MIIVSTDENGIDLGRDEDITPEHGPVRTSDLAAHALIDAGRAREANDDEKRRFREAESAEAEAEAEAVMQDLEDEFAEAGMDLEDLEGEPPVEEGAPDMGDEISDDRKRTMLESFDYHDELRPAASDVSDEVGAEPDSQSSDDLIKFLVAHWETADELGVLNP